MYTLAVGHVHGITVYYMLMWILTTLCADKKKLVLQAVCTQIPDFFPKQSVHENCVTIKLIPIAPRSSQMSWEDTIRIYIGCLILGVNTYSASAVVGNELTGP